MSLSLSVLRLELFQKFLIDFCRSVSGLVNSRPLFDEYFKLFTQVLKLFLKVILPLIVNNLIKFDPLR